MNFTEKEIQLARDMKATGLKWNPEVGDWFTSTHQDATPFFLCIKEDSPWLVHTHGEGHKDASIWLPLWNQCREILAENGIFIQLSHLRKNEVEISCYKRNKSTTNLFTGGVITNTDLEAMYQAILRFVLDVPKEE